MSPASCAHGCGRVGVSDQTDVASLREQVRADLAARIAALTWIAERLEKHVPMQPPAADPATMALARAHFGVDFTAE